MQVKVNIGIMLNISNRKRSIKKTTGRFGLIMTVLVSAIVFSLAGVASAAPTEQSCKDSGGRWVTEYVGSELKTFCKCPEGKTVIGDRCKAFNSLQYLCEQSDGSWQYGQKDGGSTYEWYCKCPAGMVLGGIGSCAVPEEETENVGDPTPGEFQTAPQQCADDNCISNNIQAAINILSIGVGLIVTIMIIIGGIQYMISRDNPQAVQAAKSRLYNAVFALVVFVFIWAFLQWIVPGGIF